MNDIEYSKMVGTQFIYPLNKQEIIFTLEKCNEVGAGTYSFVTKGKKYSTTTSLRTIANNFENKTWVIKK